jgi:outer membrane protein
MKKGKIIISLLLLISSGGLYAQTSPVVLSMKEAIEYAGGNSSNIKISELDERIARRQTEEIRGRGLPQANINGTFEDRLKIPLLVIPGGFGGAVDSTGASSGGQSDNAGGQGIPLGYKYNSSLTGEVTQMIIDPSFWIGLKAAKASTKYYQQSTQQVNEQTAYNIANSYYQIIVVQKQLQLLRSNIQSTERILATTELQFQNGVAKQVDVNRLKVNLSNLKSQIQQAEVSLVQAFNGLKFQMGMPINQEVILTDTVLAFEESQEAVLEATNEEYFTKRIDYRILQTQLELQELDKKNNSSGYYPTLTAYGNYGYQAQGPEFGLFKTSGNNWVDYTTAAIGLRLRIPVFDGLQRNARVQQSKIKSEQLKENLRLTKSNIDMEVSNATNQYRSTIQRIEAERQNVDLAQEVYNVTQLEFQEGVGTSTDVVEAETSLRQAQNTYINSLLDLYTARLNLERAKGTLITYLNSK